MPFLESFGGFAGGLAEGALAGAQLGLESEANEIRRARSEALTDISDLKREEFELRRPLIEENIAGIEDRKRLRTAALDELTEMENVRAKKESFKDVDELFNRQGKYTPNQLKYLRNWIGTSKAINEFNKVSEFDFEEFVGEMSDDPTTDFPRLAELARIGIRETGAKRDVLKTELTNLLEKGSLDIKGDQKRSELAGQIEELDQADSLYNSNLRTFSEQEGQELPTTEARFFIQKAFENAERNNTNPEDEYMALIGKKSRAELSPEQLIALELISHLLRGRGGASTPNQGAITTPDRSNPFEFEPPIE